MSVSLDQIDDITLLLLNTWKTNRYKDISVQKRRFEWTSRYLKGSKKPIRGGLKLQEQFKVRNTGTARYTGLYDGRNVATADLMKTIEVPWAMVDNNWGYDIREPAFQGGDRAIVNWLNAREQSMYTEVAEFMETAMWTKATSDTVSPVEIWGVPTWVVKGSNTNFAFGGLDPSGFSSGVGGLSSTDYPRYANGSFKYSEVSNGDLFKKWAEAHEKCNFEPPYSYEGELSPQAPNWVNYTTYPVVSAIQDFLTTANDNLKSDAGMFRGSVTFKGTPVRSVAALDDESSDAYDSQHPIYGLDWSKLYWFFQSGWDMKITGPLTLPNQTHGRFVQMDIIGNFICVDRSALYVGHTTASPFG